jgi:nucleoside diphosphate kinase
MIDEARVLATPTVASWLSSDPLKRTVYCDDLYFWDGWAAFVAACGGEPDESLLRHLTFVLIKPEAIVARRFDSILDFLLAKGFGIAGAWPTRMSRHAVRALWGYQINSVPMAWVHALEMGVTSGELFVVGLTHSLQGGEASTAAEFLRLNKGTSARPGGHSLRDQLKGPARMLSFVHAPDESADVIRELAIVCGGPDRTDASAAGLWGVVAGLVGAARHPGPRSDAIECSARKMMTSRYGQTPAHDLDVAATFLRMRGYLCDPVSAGLPPATRAAIEAGWSDPERALEVVISLEQAHALPLWDRIVTVAHLTDSFRNGRPMLITPPI